jgi:hypothetical protein
LPERHAECKLNLIVWPSLAPEGPHRVSQACGLFQRGSMYPMGLMRHSACCHEQYPQASPHPGYRLDEVSRSGWKATHSRGVSWEDSFDNSRPFSPRSVNLSNRPGTCSPCHAPRAFARAQLTGNRPSAFRDLTPQSSTLPPNHPHPKRLCGGASS